MWSSEAHPDYGALRELVDRIGPMYFALQLPSLPLMVEPTWPSVQVVRPPGTVLPGAADRWCPVREPVVHRPGLQGGMQVIGDVENVDRGMLVKSIEAVLSQPSIPEWSQHCFGLVDGLGAYRVANSRV